MSIFKSYAIASNSLNSQREAMNLAAENVANAMTPGYKAKHPVFAAKTETMSFSGILSSARGSEGLSGMGKRDSAGLGSEVVAIEVDQRQGVKIFSPYHPMADKDGYVEMSNVDSSKEMINMMESLRQYKATLSIVEMAKKAAQEAMQMTKNA